MRIPKSYTAVLVGHKRGYMRDYRLHFSRNTAYIKRKAKFEITLRIHSVSSDLCRPFATYNRKTATIIEHNLPRLSK